MRLYIHIEINLLIYQKSFVQKKLLDGRLFDSVYWALWKLNI